ncbi:MAG: cardiolipin synthase ClsB [Proteobacteria bacterium]|uniref:cardiolipin synthase ClsB n=1 Tax=Aquabacterium sp. TaxID=1872578 RepID=UPI0035C6DC5C|nr:cardiolipin synthase ClsB [Pseudomonadota bacterium]
MAQTGPESPPEDVQAGLDTETDFQALAGLAWYAQRKPVFTGGNRVRLLQGGRDLFPALAERIDAATHSVWLALYIVSPLGQSGGVLQALMRAARRGVKVHLVVDGLGSREAPGSLWKDMAAAGVALAIYRPVKGLSAIFDAGQWRRMHLKLCVVDGEHAFIGGINLIDDHYDLHHGWSDQPRLDYALQAQGPVVTPMLHTVRAIFTRAQIGRDWRDDLVQWAQDPHRLHRLQALLRQARLRLEPHEQDRIAEAIDLRQPMRSAFVLRDNLRQRRTIEQASLQAIVQARQRIDIVTPYFYPHRAIRLALRAAAARGVTVRLLLQGKLDYRIAGMAAQVLYHELQRHGVRIFEYQPAFLHAKVLCVDDEWATVGSSNLDPLSLVLNLEANLIVKDRGFVHTLSTSLNEDFALSREVPPPPDGHRPGWSERLRRGFVAWVAKTYLRLAGVTGRY